MQEPFYPVEPDRLLVLAEWTDDARTEYTLTIRARDGDTCYEVSVDRAGGIGDALTHLPRSVRAALAFFGGGLSDDV